MYNFVLARCITPNALLSFIVPCITLWGSNKHISCISVLLWVISAWDVFSVDDPSFPANTVFRGWDSGVILRAYLCSLVSHIVLSVWLEGTYGHTHTRSLACDLKNRRLLHLLPVASGVGSCLCSLVSHIVLSVWLDGPYGHTHTHTPTHVH